MKAQYDLTQQKILIAIGILERVTMDEPLDVQINLIKAFLNNTIKSVNGQARRDDVLSAISKVQVLAANLLSVTDFLKEVAVECETNINRDKRSEPETKSAQETALDIEDLKLII